MLFQNGWPLSCDVSAKGKMWKISLPCAWPLVPHRETLEDWPWKNRNAEGPLCSYLLFGSLNLDLSIHKAFFSLLRCYRSVFYSDYLTPGGPLSSFFQAWEDTNWSGILEAFLLCSFLGYLFILCFFWFIQGNELPPSKDNSDSPMVYTTDLSQNHSMSPLMYKNITSLLFQWNTSIQSILTKALQINDCMWVGVCLKIWKMCYRKHNILNYTINEN